MNRSSKSDRKKLSYTYNMLDLNEKLVLLEDLILQNNSNSESIIVEGEEDQEDSEE